MPRHSETQRHLPGGLHDITDKRVLHRDGLRQPLGCLRFVKPKKTGTTPMMVTGKNRIMIYGPKDDGTYVIEFRTAEGETLAISISRTGWQWSGISKSGCRTG